MILGEDVLTEVGTIQAHYRLLNWDGSCRFGRLSYNVMILAERTR